MDGRLEVGFRLSWDGDFKQRIGGWGDQFPNKCRHTSRSEYPGEYEHYASIGLWIRQWTDSTAENF